MGNIKVECRTNLDNYDCTLVTEMVGMPRVGDFVVVRDMDRGYQVVKLKIVSITHMPAKDFTKEPYLEIELHK